MKTAGTLKLLVVVVAAVSGTVAFMIACGSGPSHATASTASTCTQWQVAEVDMNVSCPSVNGSTTTSPCDLPAGWEPLGTYQNPIVLIGRCKP